MKRAYEYIVQRIVGETKYRQSYHSDAGLQVLEDLINDATKDGSRLVSFERTGGEQGTIAGILILERPL